MHLKINGYSINNLNFQLPAIFNKQLKWVMNIIEAFTNWKNIKYIPYFIFNLNFILIPTDMLVGNGIVFCEYYNYLSNLMINK
jgi:hypothetical protein